MNTEQINSLLTKIAEPETPEDRDEAWNEVERRLQKMEEIIEVIDRAKKYLDPDPAGRARRVIGYFKNEAMLERKRAEKAPVHYAGVHPSMGMLLNEMVARFDRWTDQIWEVNVGFTRSEYLECAAMLSRLAVLDEPSPEALAELEKLKVRFRAYRLALERET